MIVDGLKEGFGEIQKQMRKMLRRSAADRDDEPSSSDLK